MDMVEREIDRPREVQFYVSLADLLDLGQGPHFVGHAAHTANQALFTDHDPQSIYSFAQLRVGCVIQRKLCTRLPMLAQLLSSPTGLFLQLSVSY